MGALERSPRVAAIGPRASDYLTTTDDGLNCLPAIFPLARRGPTKRSPAL